MTVAPLLALGTPSDDEQQLIRRMRSLLTFVSGANLEAESFYEGTRCSEQFGISIPPNMQNLHTVAGWGGTAVDVLEERLDFLGWKSAGDPFGLAKIYAENSLDVDGGMAHLDALIFGVSFVAVGAGGDGEPDTLITPQSAKSTTAIWDHRTRRASAAMAVTGSREEGNERITLYMPDETVVFGLQGGIFSALDRDRHNLGRVPVVPFPNRVRASRHIGRSEISKAVRYYVDAANRTLLGLEVNREFYNAPQRIGLNIPREAMEDSDGNLISQWSAIQGRMWMVPPVEDGMAAPDVKQLSPASPAPYIDQVRGYAQLLAAEIGVPSSYLGFVTDNPSSADAIRAGEARLVKRAERRQTVFGRAWMEVARLALMVSGEGIPDDFESQVSPQWRKAATPTEAAAADAGAKIAAVIPGFSQTDAGMGVLGLDPDEIKSYRDEMRRSGGNGVLDALRQQAQSQPLNPPTPPNGQLGA